MLLNLDRFLLYAIIVSGSFASSEYLIMAFREKGVYKSFNYVEACTLLYITAIYFAVAASGKHSIGDLAFPWTVANNASILALIVLYASRGIVRLWKR